MPQLKPTRGICLNRSHPLSRGLAGLWLFNEGSGGQVFDLSRNGNTGTFAGTAPSWRAGKFGSAVLLPGTNEYIEVPYNASLESSDFTVSIWVYRTSGRGIIKRGDYYEADSREWVIQVDGANLKVCVGQKFWSAAVAGYIPVNTWTHLLLSYENGVYLQIYINGIRVHSQSAYDTHIANTNPIIIGEIYNGYLNGMVDNVLFYNRALSSSSEIAQLYREPFCMVGELILPAYFFVPDLGALTANVYDEITVTESVTPQLPLLLADVSDSVTVDESVAPLMPLLLSTLFDSVGVTESITPLMPLFQAEVSDSITVEESVTPLMPLLEVYVYDSVTVVESVTPSTGIGDWIGIDSSHYDSHCGEDVTHTLAEGLDGTDYWRHDVDETHSFVVDLGQEYNVQKVRGRSNHSFDPTDVNIYVNNTGEAPWGDAVASGIDTWQDTAEWVEIDTIDKIGRYIKVEIISTEDIISKELKFGAVSEPYFAIFDVYGVGVPLSVSVYDSVSVAEDVSALMPLLIAEVSDEIAVTENIDTLLPLLIAEVSDSITVSESIEAKLPLYEVLEYDSITVAEDVALESALLTASVYDSIAVSELITIYISSMWTRVMGDNDITWQNPSGSNSMTWQNPTDSNDVEWRNP